MIPLKMNTAYSVVFIKIIQEILLKTDCHNIVYILKIYIVKIIQQRFKNDVILIYTI